MRSLFWRILATFWLAITLVAALAMLLGRALNQDAWIIGRHPAIKNLAADWAQVYEQRGPASAQRLLEQQKQRFHIDTQVLSENGHPLIPGTFPPRAAALEARRQHRAEQLPWRRLTSEYTSPTSDETYLFIYRIPHPELDEWHRDSLLWPLSAIGIALIVLSGFSLLLTLSITRPLDRLRGAVHDLGQTSYQQTSLARLARRRDELGLLASDFNRMGARLQSLIGSQRQLLRDVSHELRSPLARLRIALALAERATPEERQSIWPRLEQECDRLETLIAEILELARLDAEPGAPVRIDLDEVFSRLRENARITAPDTRILSRVQPGIEFQGWPDMLERALDNLLRNALRFNPPGSDIELNARLDAGQLLLSVRDHGPGVDPAHLPHLSQPFYRAPGQTAAGHGLGLAIAQRAAERHGGRLCLDNHPEGGFTASLQLPLAGAAYTETQKQPEA
ncbi:HAMP domain-containing sensor histidine kinase [Stutzerimonas kirkiae]|uniref:histidine kinase n=1 Tax=Stutzerimonas kirkiae TaxID=2211392 RepID=A0A4Q9REH1_9GAMM|nr:HAMP domain-containing sensor histidine kinase [Stutzerimonas kirkiae]TBU99990.1 two-component sensor histidine kinase [Stutzerimonas kirkiae]TBV05696.1 two-component sensor histidine kinase [Stutzerimonas kirkiae]TBV10561.1 two-component sensor histidine kinase [Stutzerimonas kirkiae]TBV17419.1 two-component sensor histidine kinase [Stutzerimonas kirkiae]